MEAEGHGSRPPGLDPRSELGGRRHGVRSDPAQLRAVRAAPGARAGPQERVQRPGARGGRSSSSTRSTTTRRRRRRLQALLDAARRSRDRKVLILTDGVKPNVFLSGPQPAAAHVMPYADVSTYHILWSDVVLVEAGALGQTLDAGGRDGAGASRRRAEWRSRRPKDEAERAPKAEAKRAAQAAGGEEGGGQEDAGEEGRRRKKAGAPRRRAAKKPSAPRRRGSNRCRHCIRTIVRPMITEKSSAAFQDRGEYTFEVHPEANKYGDPAGDRAAVRRARSPACGRRTQRGKTAPRRRQTAGRRPNWKKAIVKLSEGDTIEIFEG